MSATFTASDAKNQFADALRRAEGGDVVLITRFGKPSAALISAERLAQLEELADAAQAADAVAESGPVAAPETVLEPVPEPMAAEVSSAVPVAVPADAPADLVEGTPEALLEEAAAAGLRRIDYDLARLPEKLRPVLRLIRGNLFHPRLTVERVKATLKIGGHDLTSHFRRVTGAPIRRYVDDRRLEAASRLLVDSELTVEVIARLVGYSGSEPFSRAFKRRFGVRARVYREFEGLLAPEVAADAAAGRVPLAPRFLAGVARLPAEVACARCGGGLAPDERLRVFEQLAPICAGCARDQAPALSALL